MDYHYCRYTGTWNGASGDYLQGQMLIAAGFFLMLRLSNSCGLVVPVPTHTNVLLQGNTPSFQGRSITEPVQCGKSRQPQPCKIPDFSLQGLSRSYRERLVSSVVGEHGKGLFLPVVGEHDFGDKSFPFSVRVLARDDY